MEKERWMHRLYLGAQPPPPLCDAWASNAKTICVSILILVLMSGRARCKNVV